MAAGAAGAAGVAVGPRVVNFTNPVTGSSRTPGAAPSTPDAPSSDAPGTAETPKGDADTPSSPDSDAPDSPESDAPASPDDSAKDSDEPKKNVPTIEDIKSWLADVNPGYKADDPNDLRSINCGMTTAAVWNRLSGNGTPVAGTGTLSVAEMEAATGRPQVAMSPEAIHDQLVAGGAGSHAVVGIDRNSGDGHWFNAYYDGTNVVAVDGQTGQVYSWPPDYGDIRNWDAAVDPANPPAIDAEGKGDNSAGDSTKGDSTKGDDAQGDTSQGDTADTGDDANADSSSRDDTRGSSAPRDPAVQQPITPHQSGIIDGTHAGNSASRIVESPAVMAEVADYNDPKPAHGMLDSKYGPKTGRTLVTGAAADALNFNHSEPWGHDANGDRLNKATWSERYVNPGGKMQWAPNDGAVPGTRVQYDSIASFTSDWGNLAIDRLGELSGTFMGVGGGDFNARALPPSQAKATLFHEVEWKSGATLPAGYSIEIARIADAYGQDGGGLQMVVRDPNGKFVKLQDLMDLKLVTVDTVIGATP